MNQFKNKVQVCISQTCTTLVGTPAKIITAIVVVILLVVAYKLIQSEDIKIQLG
jgi:hypothetical protein